MVDDAPEEGSSREDDRLSLARRSVSQDDSRATIALDRKRIDHALPDIEVRLTRDELLHGPSVELAIDLRPRPPYGWPLRPVKDTELQPRHIGSAPDQTVERIDLPDQVPLADAADRRVARQRSDLIASHRDQ